MPTLTLPIVMLVFSAATQPARDFATIDACRVVPGSVVAQALGGTLVKATPFATSTFSRCTYVIAAAGTKAQAGYAVWLQAAADFDELRQYSDRPLTDLTGLGERAYLFHDKGDGRFKINVVKRRDLMFQVTGDTADSARTVAAAVAAHLWPPKTPEKP
jgi:hypothetical protein